MKVAIVTTRHGAQDDRIYYKQALSLAQRMDVVMIAPDDGEKLSWHPNVIFYPIPRRLSPIGRLWSLVVAVSAIRRENPDFCHLHDLDLALAIPFIRLFSKAKVIYDSHEVFAKEDIILGLKGIRASRVIACLVEQTEKIMLKASHYVITAVDPDGKAFVGLKVPKSIIFNYPPISIFKTDQKDIDLAKEAYVDSLPIIYQGTISADRGVFHMLDAMALVKKKEPRILLRLVGMQNDSLKKAIVQRISTLGLENNVEITGWLPHKKIAVAMKASLIGLVPLQPNPKYNRSLPIKLLEYLACGLPVISARLPLVESYMKDCNAGLLYDSTSSEELACCVLDLLADKESLCLMGQNGNRAVQERWNWSNMEKVLFQVYETLGVRWKDNNREGSISA